MRFQAEHSNDCWQFDLTPSDLKEVEEPSCLQANKGAPTLMLLSVVDDRSGVAYQEYRCLYGEDVDAALRFLFKATAPKQIFCCRTSKIAMEQRQPHAIRLKSGAEQRWEKGRTGRAEIFALPGDLRAKEREFAD